MGHHVEIKNTDCSTPVAIYQILICVHKFLKTNPCCLSWRLMARTNKAVGRKQFEPEEFNQQPKIQRTDEWIFAEFCRLFRIIIY